MPEKVHHIKKYNLSLENTFFFDTNVWLYVYGPIAYQDWKSEIYSSVLKKMHDLGCPIYTNSMVISEFINSFARMEFKQQSTFMGFKDFRNSSEFLSTAEEIAYNVKKILNITFRCDSDLADLDLINLVNNFETGSYDFNDLIFTEICKNRGMILVTHDGDFKSSGLEVLTANRKLLNS